MFEFNKKELGRYLLQEVADKVDVIKSYSTQDEDLQGISIAVSMINTISKFIDLTDGWHTSYVAYDEVIKFAIEFCMTHKEVLHEVLVSTQENDLPEPLLWMRLGLIAKQLNNYQEAITIYEWALTLKPDPATASYLLANIGVAYRHENDYGKAEQHYLRSLELKPSALTLSNLAYLYYHERRIEKAEIYFKKALDLDASISFAWHYLGLTYSRRQKFKEAEECYRKALDLDAADPNIMIDLANCLMDQEFFTEAEMYYQKALQIDPSNAIGWFNLGHYHHVVTQNYTKARELCLTALKHNPDYKKPKLLLKEIQKLTTFVDLDEN